MNKKSKTLVFFLSFIPGAGQMYLGLMSRGVQLMGAFFFITFLMGWLNLQLLAFILPVIWCYSLFDALHRADGSVEIQPVDEMAIFNWLEQHPKAIGGGLIGIGIFMVFDRLIAPLISYNIRGYLQTGLVALALIAIGVKLLIGGQKEEVEK